MGVFALLQRTFARPTNKNEPSGTGMESRVRSQAGAAGSGRDGHRSAAAAAAREAREAADIKPPRGSREAMMLLKQNGFDVLSEGRQRGARHHEQPAQRGQPAQEKQEKAAQQEKQQQRHVRVVEPADRRSEKRRPTEKRKAVESSSSEDERPVRPARSTQQPPAAQQPAAQQQQQTALKRVRSSAKMLPLAVDAKLAVFIEGRDDTLVHYDGGEFYAWLKDCEAGLADPADGCPYPLIVQDKEMRTVLEIKGPEQAAPAAQGPHLADAARQAPAAAAADSSIIVPHVRLLPPSEQPDHLVREQKPPVVQRTHDSSVEPPDVVGVSAAAMAALEARRATEVEEARDPPYKRYVQPTPDDLDLAVEYDLDEEDEEWLEQYNMEARRAKSRKGRRTLGEEWMEHLIDRMEKEYTAELQRHPEKWVVQAAEPGGGASSGQPPAITIPSIDEVFPLDKCLQVPGINHYQHIIQAVYEYWKAKHQRGGRPLIQRLWYEPPWDRKKAAQRLASNAADGGEGGGGLEDGPFAAQDSPVALAGIRRRRLDPAEAKARFQEMRRDLEAARTLADQVRKREKLKKRELQLCKEEWAARMQAICDGALHVVVRQGAVKDPPAQLSAVWRMEAAGLAIGLDPASSGELEQEHMGPVPVGAPQDPAAQAEERAARLAMRRFARDAATAGLPVAQHAPAAAAAQAARPPPRPRAAAAAVQQQQRKGTEREGARGAQPRAVPAASPMVGQGAAVNVRGPPPPPGVRRVPTCAWCRSAGFLMLGCSTCHRCHCFKCYQVQPGLGPNNWSRAVKDPRYQCLACRAKNGDEEAAAADAAAAEAGAHAVPAGQPGGGARKARGGRLEAAAAAADVLPPPPKGLGGAALRSYLLKRQREADEQLAEQEQGSEEGVEEEEQQDVPQQQQQPQKRGRGRPRGSVAAHARRQQQQQQQLADSSSSSGEEEGEDEERRPKQRKLGGAALASHLRRLEQQRQQRKQQRVAAAEQPSSSSSGGEGGDEDDEEEEDEWPHTHIPAPARKLGGAALQSYIRRQEQLLAEQQQEQEAGSDSEQPATSSHGGSAEGWPYSHIPAPARKLGGAALRSYIRRQEQLLQEAGGGAGGGDEPSGSSSGTAEEFGASSESAGTSELAAPGGASSSDVDVEVQSDHKENRAQPAKRPRLGGAALASHLRKQQALQAAAAADAAAAAAASRRPTGGGTGRRSGREAR